MYLVMVSSSVQLQLLVLVLRGGRPGGGGGDAAAGGAHGEGGGRGHVHVLVRGDELERAELLHLLLQPPVLLRQRLAAALQELAVHLRLLQLRPACTCNTGSNVTYQRKFTTRTEMTRNFRQRFRLFFMHAWT